MQTIKIEKPEKIGDPTEWARGRNGMFKPAEIELIQGFTSPGTIACHIASSKMGNASPIMIVLKKETWKNVLIALGEELGK